MSERLPKRNTLMTLLPWIVGISVLAAAFFQRLERPILAVLAGLFLGVLLTMAAHFHRQAMQWARRYEQTRSQLLTSREELALKEQWAIAKAKRVGELEEAQKQLRILAHHDGLTGLPNRLSFHEHLGKSIRQNLRHERALAILFIDLDGFKAINDSFGHQVGDDLLITTARRLRNCARYEDFIARLSGDEFSIILTEVAKARDAAIVAHRVVRSLAEPVFQDGRSISVTASVGVAVMPTDGRTVDTLLNRADQAMYAAKKGGRNRYRLFSDLHRDPLGGLEDTPEGASSVRPHSPVLATRA